MPESYKRLGAIAPVDSEEYVLYSTPASTQSLLSNITVTNRSSSSATFDINVYDENVGSQGSVLEDPLFVALLSASTQIAGYSTDAITWTQTTMPVAAYWHNISYGNGLFFATSRQTFTGSSDTQIAAYSTDAITWTQTTMPVAADWMASVYAFGNWIVNSTGSNIYAKSTDLITWTQGTFPENLNTRRFILKDGLLISSTGAWEFDEITARSARTSAISLSSTDGSTWTVSTVTSTTGVYDIAQGNNIIIQTRSLVPTNIANISTNGTTWTQTTLPISSRGQSLLFGDGNFIHLSIISSPPSTFIYSKSTDGITWTQGTTSITAEAYHLSSVYGNGTFLSAASYGFYSSAQLATSTDGTTWSSNSLPFEDFGVHDVSYAGQPLTSPSQNNLYKTSIIDGNETLVLEPGIALSPENSVVVKDNSSGNLTFSTYGVELS